jgi:putative acyl-CoA dehydrogenase
MSVTHEVFNQPPELVDYDLAGADPILVGSMEREGGGWAAEQVQSYGRKMASDEMITLGFKANENKPELLTHDRHGNRIDRVEFHNSWHQLLDFAVSEGLHSLPWERGPGEGGYPARVALTFLASQIEAGHWCPISMACSAIPTLRLQPEVASFWEPLQLSRDYDPSFQPAAKKTGVMFGMGMTEKQGGSDVRANTTIAEPLNGGGPGGEYLITGHKWFMSSPMSDAFLILARAPGGLSCFLLPRFTPDGELNRIWLQRLKNKLGNWSNASSEAEFDGAWAQMVGEEGRGVRSIIEMVAGTRLDCIVGSASLMRQAVTQAVHHSVHRSAFGSPLIEKQAMLNVLADLEVETEAAVLMMMRVAGAFDRADLDEHEAGIKRILTPVVKYWVTKRCSEVVREALECLGGNGYVEDSIMPRLYRESPLNAIWEGSGNVMALDVIRVLSREQDAVEALRQELDSASGVDPRLDRAVQSALRAVDTPEDPEYQARRLVEDLAMAVAGALLSEHGRPPVWDAFAMSRLESNHGYLYGTLPTSARVREIVEPAVPTV